MKIAIDVTQVVYGSGVSVYTKELVKALLALDKENQYILFGGALRRKADLTKFLSSLKGNFKTVKLPFPPRFADLVWNKLEAFPVELFLGKIDVFHSSDWTQPPSSAFKVTTIHDLVPIKYPKLSHPRVVSTHTKRLEIVRKKVDRIIVPSNETFDDLVSMGFRKDRLRCIPEAPNSFAKKAKAEEVTKVLEKFNVKKPFLLGIGINPRKNTEKIIEAYKKLKKHHELELVLVGYPYSELKFSEGIIATGHVTDDELSALYTAAQALVYPSLYEGFGLPILDAFACGTPVVTSDSGSMKEIAMGAAVLVNPLSTLSIKEGIEKAFEEASLLTQKGKTRVKSYTWHKTAISTLSVYKEHL